MALVNFMLCCCLSKLHWYKFGEKNSYLHEDFEHPLGWFFKLGLLDSFNHRSQLLTFLEYLILQQLTYHFLSLLLMLVHISAHLD